MNIQGMNNEDYKIELDERTQVLAQQRDEMLELSRRIMKDNLSYETFFFIPAINRSMAILSGMQELLVQRNLICASILLRAQIDNCMRIFAAFIAEDQQKFLKGFLNGVRIDKMKSNEGKSMSDGYLKEKLSVYDDCVADAYNYGSGFVHLSKMALYTNTSEADTPGYDIEITVGVPLPEKYNSNLIEIADAFVHFIWLQDNMLTKVAISLE